MLRAVAKRVIIQPIEEKQGTVLLANQKPKKFTVIAVGETVTTVKPKDVIFLEKHYGVEIDHENEKYLVIDEGCILAKITNPGYTGPL